MMETKHILALIIFMALGSIGVLCTLLSQRARDAALFFMVLGAVMMGRMDVNFFGEACYRGTSRGVEMTLVDLAAWSLLIATVLLPRYRGGGGKPSACSSDPGRCSTRPTRSSPAINAKRR